MLVFLFILLLWLCFSQKGFPRVLKVSMWLCSFQPPNILGTPLPLHYIWPDNGLGICFLRWLYKHESQKNATHSNGGISNPVKHAQMRREDPPLTWAESQLKSYLFVELKLHAEFWNPRTTTFGRTVLNTEERRRKENVISEHYVLSAMHHGSARTSTQTN